MTVTTAAGTPAAGALHASALSPAPSSVSIFMRLRRQARRQHSWLRTVSEALRDARRAHSSLVADTSPFNRARIEKSNAYVEVVRGIHKEARDLSRKIGEALIAIAPCLDEDLNFEQRLNLINCNPADAVPIEEENRGMLYLMGVYCLEDSAAHRHDQWNDRPLHSAVNAHIQHQMFFTPEGKAASAEIFEEVFAPGGMFHGVSKYFRQEDGTMLRQPPALVLHSAGGTLVVERVPS